MSRSTSLNALHRAAGARMVDFGGWDMPLHYGSQLDEHHAVRRGAGMFDVSHMRVVDIEGPAARAFLRRAIANDVARLVEPGKALYGCLLAPDGGVVDDLIVYFVRDGVYRLVVNAGTADGDIAWLSSLRDQHAPGLAIRPRPDLAIIAVQGPTARGKVWRALPGSEAATAALKPFSAAVHGDCFIARTGYTGEDGFEIVMPAARAEANWTALAGAGVRPCGLGARDTLRLEAWMNLYGQDMDAKTSPLDAGLAWTVDLSGERDFVGRAALVAAGQRRVFLGLVLLDGGGVLRAHQTVHTSHGEGEITSGTYSPTMSRSIALARLPIGVAAGDPVEVAVRDKRLRARVVKPPFVRAGQVRVPLD